MFRYLSWWKIPLIPIYVLGWLVDQTERLSWKAGDFLDGWLPRFRLRIRKDSRIGRLILKATGYGSPTFCETLWSTVALTFRARVLRWLWVLLGLVTVGLCLVAVFGVGYAFYDGVRTQGLGPTVATSGLAVGAFILLVLAVGILLAAAEFVAEHLCPVKFEIKDNGEGASA